MVLHQVPDFLVMVVQVFKFQQHLEIQHSIQVQEDLVELDQQVLQFQMDLIKQELSGLLVAAVLVEIILLLLVELKLLVLVVAAQMPTIHGLEQEVDPHHQEMDLQHQQTPDPVAVAVVENLLVQTQ